MSTIEVGMIRNAEFVGEAFGTEPNVLSLGWDSVSGDNIKIVVGFLELLGKEESEGACQKEFAWILKRIGKLLGSTEVQKTKREHY